MLEVRDVRVELDGRPLLHDVSLTVDDGETVALLGPSGSGKTTLLRLIAGLQDPVAGAVILDGREMAGVPVHQRNVGLMFQDYALFPHRTVAGNVEFGLRAMGIPWEERRRRARELLRLVHLDGFEDHMIRELSGGMQQRVAIARALATRPAILLMDEPFGAVDALTRLSLQADLLELQQVDPRTVVLVTHDISEAVLLSDRVAIMSGRPSRIVETLAVDLPRPRQRTNPRFSDLCERILKVIGA